MIRINLLPHREEKRKERRQQFFVVTGLIVALGFGIGALVHTINAGNIDSQDKRNRIFKQEIAKLEEEIKEIQGIREEIEKLLNRKQVIESLQSERAETVHLFNELAARVPEGIYLTSIKQAGKKITLNGVAQSNARVSLMMGQLNNSPFLQNSEVVKIEADRGKNRQLGVYKFEVSVYIERSAEPASATVANAVSPQRG
ncbi:MAG: PilN domain-containing protein [Azoarcus sp.]|jgi:type IV pilus assembly protein PilN|nr:PilN domain-containing protein [Azoarcus sp.]